MGTEVNGDEDDGDKDNFDKDDGDKDDGDKDDGNKDDGDEDNNYEDDGDARQWQVKTLATGDCGSSGWWQRVIRQRQQQEAMLISIFMIFTEFNDF